MWMQTANRSDTERVWLNVTNNSGTTLSAHYPVFKYDASANAASVSTNEVAPADSALGAAGVAGAIVGLAYEDIANGEESGVVQAYGYHESLKIMAYGGTVTVNPGTAVGAVKAAASVGLSSVGVGGGGVSPVVVLDTVTAAQLNAGSIVDHCFIRAL